MHNAQYYWVVQYNIIRTELRKVSAQLTTTGECQERDRTERQAGGRQEGMRRVRERGQEGWRQLQG